MRIKLSPSAVHSDAALASLPCAGIFKVGYFLDSLRISHKPRVVNGTNRYSTAVFVAELERKYFVLEVRKEKFTTFRTIN